MNHSACVYADYPTGYTLPFSPCRYAGRKGLINPTISASTSATQGFQHWETKAMNEQQHVLHHDFNVCDAAIGDSVTVNQSKLCVLSSPKLRASPLISKQSLDLLPCRDPKRDMPCDSDAVMPATPRPESAKNLSKTPTYSTTPSSSFNLTTPASRSVRRVQSSSKYGAVMSMPQLPIPMLEKQQESSSAIARLHDSTLLREIRSHPRPLYPGLPYPVARSHSNDARSSSSTSTDALALTDVLRDIRGQVRPQLVTHVDDDDNAMVEFQLRCRARRQRYTATTKGNNTNNNNNNSGSSTTDDQRPTTTTPCVPTKEQEPRPFLAPVKSQLRVLRCSHSNGSLGRTKSSSNEKRSGQKKDIAVDFSTRTGSRRKKIRKKDAKHIMEEMVGLSVVDEKEESNSNSLDVVGPTMPCRLPPLRRRNAIQEVRLLPL